MSAGVFLERDIICVAIHVSNCLELGRHGILKPSHLLSTDGIYFFVLLGAWYLGVGIRLVIIL